MLPTVTEVPSKEAMDLDSESSWTAVFDLSWVVEEEKRWRRLWSIVSSFLKCILGAREEDAWMFKILSLEKELTLAQFKAKTSTRHIEKDWR